MSVQALGWVFDHSPTHGTDRLVLLSIANHARKAPSGKGWEAYPGVKTIQREAGLERTRTVIDSLTRLEAAGALIRIVNGAPDIRIRADRRPNLYQIVLEHGVSCGDTACGWCGDPRGVAPASNGVSPDDRTGCREATPEPSVEPSVEPEGTYVPSVESAIAPSQSVAAAFPRLFDAFWMQYPLKVGKRTARTAFERALKRASWQEIVAGAIAYRDWPSRDPAFTCHPTTWLNRDGWADELIDRRPATKVDSNRRRLVDGVVNAGSGPTFEERVAGAGGQPQVASGARASDIIPTSAREVG